MISLVVPTFNESGTIEQLIQRASEALSTCQEPFEIVIVDDASEDGTAELAEALSTEYPVRVLRRPGRLGLATAVIQGWEVSGGDKLAVIDGDLQHPPELLPKLINTLDQKGVGIAVASRHVEGGGVSEWSLSRHLVSWVATRMAMLLLPKTLSRVRDPMSGYFVVRKQILEGVELRAAGYKILLEVLSRASGALVVEVPYIFTERSLGASKLGPLQLFEYLQHLARLSLSTGEVWQGTLTRVLIFSAFFLVVYLLYTSLT